MTTSSRIFAVVASMALLVGCDAQSGGEAVTGKPQAAVPAGADAQGAGAVPPTVERNAEAVFDKALPQFQLDLIELAFESATAIPVDPHVKDRSRAQELIVEAAFELDQPRRALGYVERIDNWRRGSGYADFAFYCANHGAKSEIAEYLQRAEKISETAEDWRKDRVRVKIARTHARLGDDDDARRFEENVVSSEAGKVAAVRARLSTDDAAFQRQSEALRAALATGIFDVMINAYGAAGELFDHYYEQEPKRTQIMDMMRTSSGKMPAAVRVDMLMRLATIAADHKDSTTTLMLANEAQQILDEAQWLTEDRVPRMAKLAALRHRAGETERARTDAAAALALYEKDRELIVDIYRAGALRPLAEAYQTMGDGPTALAMYRRAVEEGVANPNARPRALDLAATCTSMATHAVEPDEALWVRMRAIRDNLGTPW